MPEKPPFRQTNVDIGLAGVTKAGEGAVELDVFNVDPRRRGSPKFAAPDEGECGHIEQLRNHFEPGPRAPKVLVSP